LIPYGKHHIDQEDIDAVVDVLRHDWLTQGPKIEEFENAIADYVGAKYAVAISSGTAGLHIAALATGMQKGDLLLTSPITFVASANAGIYTGGDVIFADVDPDTINLSPHSVKTAFSEKNNIKVIVPVHFAGLPCQMGEIKTLADQASAVIIEDAAHALGAIYPSGKKVGSCENSLMTVFSFHPVKAIAAGEGGMITTNDESIYRKLIRLRGHGINKLDDPFLEKDQAFTGDATNPWYYEMQEIGYNYRLTDIQCALGISQFQKLGKFMSRRRAIVKNYDIAFSEMSHCRPAQLCDKDFSGNHLYVIRIDFNSAGINRASLMKELKQRGIGTQVHYIPVPSHPFYRQKGFKPEDYPNALHFYEEALSIPLYYDLTDHEQDQVISAIKDLIH
jgi:perosamine synthetase